MSEENTIYESPQVKITNLRAIINNTTYPISNITSVGTSKIDDVGCFPPGLILFGILATIGSVPSFFNHWSADNQYAFLALGILALIISFYIIKTNKPTYILKLSTAAGEVKALESDDKEHIAKITEALNTAIIQKG